MVGDTATTNNSIDIVAPLARERDRNRERERDREREHNLFHARHVKLHL